MDKQPSPSTIARHAHALAATLGLDLVRGPPLPSLARKQPVKGAYWTARPKPEAMVSIIGPAPDTTPLASFFLSIGRMAKAA